MRVFPADTLREVGFRIFRAVGSPDPVARRVGDALVDANLVGHDSHGVIRIPNYVDAVRTGEIVPDAEPIVVKEAASTALINGGWGFGQVTGECALRLAVDKAQAQGVAVVGAVRCNHLGRMGEYAEMAGRRGAVGFVTAGGFGGRGARATPFGGRAGLLGTNPLTFGIPSQAGEPMLVDFATTSIAAGKIEVARAKGSPLPPGSIVDRSGNPTTNADDFYEGGWLLPFGGHKGYGLAMVVELLGRVLTGADDYTEEGRGGPVYSHSGALFVAIDAGVFRDRSAVEAGVDDLLERARDVPPAPGFERVLTPGEPEQRTRAQRLASGIAVEDVTVAAIRQTAGELGLDAASLLP
jgi:LDH2 family malate/lactate/ureidoglycolate dehydrogenase